MLGFPVIKLYYTLRVQCMALVWCLMLHRLQDLSDQSFAAM